MLCPKTSHNRCSRASADIQRYRVCHRPKPAFFPGLRLFLPGRLAPRRPGTLNSDQLFAFVAPVGGFSYPQPSLANFRYRLDCVTEPRFEPDNLLKISPGPHPSDAGRTNGIKPG